MLPVERLNRIKELIQEKKNIKIAELSSELNVSEMTIHRDLKPLVEEGLIVKTFGGISLAESKPMEPNDTCIYCSRTINEKMAYRLILPNNKIEIACCAHCGLLRHQQLGDEVIQAICYDFFRQTTISAQLASFVMDTTIDMGCCQPQVLSFEWQDHAQKFVKGFGGNVYPFDEAMETVFNKMTGKNGCCHK
ncbi:DeoR family transcriptional regulator [Pseudogracilibacillus auburnensis]|uniref:DeoR/GlpR family transcriptional regulator of sugar metabolism n=1 Tax=Pseudogracilibacillus auburnensis TaxID=1494959 RepID=A0A2V3W0I5_9BACI|nr:DeoR family transcriptional regulator [Pseudogracilibacillus auburnensis]MBO1002242.1 DeoR family transcriptional regulator [Pseudogracilibacillus auburnensis]PXW87572.1 DeoR/GlpR family transcriptional regulator of sugar metabolism [Pseudogracilibacillus auburnensis]